MPLFGDATVLPAADPLRASPLGWGGRHVLATLVGIVPGTFVFVNLGQTLGRIESVRGLVSVETLAAFALLGLFALVPVALRRLRARREAPPAPR